MTSDSEDDFFPDLADLLRSLPSRDPLPAPQDPDTSLARQAELSVPPTVTAGVSRVPLSRSKPIRPFTTPRRRRRIICDSDEDESEFWEVPDSTESVASRFISIKADQKLDEDLCKPQVSASADQLDRMKPWPRCEPTLGVALTTLTLSSSPPSLGPADSAPDVIQHKLKGLNITVLSSPGPASSSIYFSCDSSQAAPGPITGKVPENLKSPPCKIKGSVARISKDKHTSPTNESGNELSSRPDLHEVPLEQADSDTDLSDRAVLVYSPPPASARKPVQLKDLSLLPSTPSRDCLSLRGLTRSPFRESSIDFWDEQKNAAWVQERTPLSARLPRTYTNENGPPPSTPMKMPRKTAAELASARMKKKFVADRETIGSQFLATFIEKIYPGVVDLLAEPIEILWSKSLTSTAGRATYSKSRKVAKIELSEKVIDSETRLKSTLSHEMCHILVWCVNEHFAKPHGKEFKDFGDRVHTELGIKVETTHAYEISYKYQWTCTNISCAKEYGRHSKSIDPRTSVCASCHSKIVQTRPKPRATGASPTKTSSSADSPRKNDGLSKYQAFLKSNMPRIKLDHPGLKYAELVKLVAAEYAESKLISATPPPPLIQPSLEIVDRGLASLSVSET